MYNTDIWKATLKSRLEEALKKVEDYHTRYSALQRDFDDKAALADQMQADNQALRDESGVCSRCGGPCIPSHYRRPTVESMTEEEADEMSSAQQHRPNPNSPENLDAKIGISLTFVSATDSSRNQRTSVFLRRRQSLQDVLGPKLFGRLAFDALAFVHKAQRIGDVGLTAAEVSG